MKEYLVKNFKKSFIKLFNIIYLSPILFTKKKDKSLRFYVNYYQLNALIKKD
jgi:hypothetical protein